MSPTPSRKLSIKKIGSGILSINTSKYRKILKIFEGAMSYLANTESKFNSLCKTNTFIPLVCKFAPIINKLENLGISKNSFN